MNVSNIRYILAAITPFVEAFEELKVNYHIGGSVASTVHGIMRATIDADIVKIQGTKLDMVYLQRWAAVLKVTDLLERALVDAGLVEGGE